MTPKTRRVVLAIMALLIVVLAILLWSRRAPVQTTDAKQTPIDSHADQATNQSSASSSTSKGAAGAPPPSITKAAEEHGRQLQHAFETLNDNPIEFYGRAVDQSGAPVPGAAVTGIVLYNTGDKSGERRNKTATDADGFFRFTGLRGQDLGIDIVKDGYEYHPRNTSFSYTYFEADHKRHVPDPNNAVIFTLWKKQGAEALVHYDLDRDIPADGTPVRINLETGKAGGPDADLIVSVYRSPLVMDYGTGGFAWKTTVDVVGGGLVRAGEHDYYNTAPETGYVPRLEYAQEAQNYRDAQEGRAKWTWRESLSDTFFVSSRDGKNFARVTLRIMANADRKRGDNIGAVRTIVWLNPNRSRNLEFDSKKAIRPAP